MNAFCYARYSSDNQREESIEAQLAEIQKYCRNNNIHIKKTFTDEAESARTDDRPAFLQMIGEIKSGAKVDCIVVHKIDRFARDRIDAAYHKYTLKKHKVKILYAAPSQQFGDNAEGRLMEGIMESFAQYYSENLATEVMKGLNLNAQKGIHNGGIPPLGYNVTPNKKYEINQTEAVIVRTIFEMYDRGNGYKSIAIHLNKNGYLTKTGKEFGQNSIRDVLLNEKYNGTYTYNKRSSADINGKRNGNKLKNDEDIIRVPGAVPAIIEKELWKRVNDKMKDRKRKPRLTSNRTYLLTGLIECGECGSAYVGIGYKNKEKNYYYGCTHRHGSERCKNKFVNQEYIEAYIINELMNNIFSDEAIEKLIPDMIAYIKGQFTEYESEKKKITEQISSVRKKINNLLDAVEDGDPDAKERLALRRREIQDLQERLDFINASGLDWASEENIRNFLVHFRDDLNSQDPVAKRKVIETFVDKIIIYPDRYETTFKIGLGIGDKVGGGEPYQTISLCVYIPDFRLFVKRITSLSNRS